MANVEHNSLTGSALHENKGVSSATDDYVATATSGATVWKKLTAANLTGTGNPFGGQLFHLREAQSKSTSSQTAFSTTYAKVTLNTSVTNEISGASVSGSVITLPSGTYFIEADVAVSANIDVPGRLRLRNTTAGSNLVIGRNWYPDGSAGSWPATLKGRFTLSGTSNIELQWAHQSTSEGAGVGVSVVSRTADSVNEQEIYSDVLIWKTA